MAVFFPVCACVVVCFTALTKGPQTTDTAVDDSKEKSKDKNEFSQGLFSKLFLEFSTEQQCQLSHNQT